MFNLIQTIKLIGSVKALLVIQNLISLFDKKQKKKEYFIDLKNMLILSV